MRSFGGMSVRPEAWDISIMAVLPYEVSAIPYDAVTNRPSGSETVTDSVFPPRAFVSVDDVPSPPSAMSRQVVAQSGNTVLMPLAAAFATSREESEPLNESDAMMILRMVQIYEKRDSFGVSSLFWYSVGESNPYCKIENLEY